MSARRVGRALWLPILLVATVAYAQLPGRRPLRVSACSGSVDVLLTRPDGTSISEHTDGGIHPYPLFDWWNGPGVYRLEATTDDGERSTSSFRTYDTELDVVVAVCGSMFSNVAVADPRVTARLVRSSWALEVHNATESGWRAFAQDRLLHYETDPMRTDPSWTLDERRARTTDTQSGCGTGGGYLGVAAQETARLPLSRWVPDLPGDYTGTVRLFADDGHQTFVSFEFSIVPADSPRVAADSPVFFGQLRLAE